MSAIGTKRTYRVALHVDGVVVAADGAAGHVDVVAP